MGAKLGDFLLRVIGFFGILLPGAVFLFLVFFQHKWIASLLNLTPDKRQVLTWVIFLITSFVLGQFLAIVSVPLNNLLRRFSSVEEDTYYQQIKNTPLLKGLNSARGQRKRWFNNAVDTLFNSEERSTAFYRVLAFIRLKEKASALADIEQQMAEYKLFRSLVLVFFLDAILWVIGLLFNGWGDIPVKAALWRIVLSLILFCFAVFRFLHLLKWTYRITFEYYTLLLSENEAARAATVGSSTNK